MSELRKRLAKAELDTETETETGNQDSDAVSIFNMIYVFYFSPGI